MSTVLGEGKICFFCRKPIEGEAIEWQEQNNWMENPEGEGLISILLHPECSVPLGMRLIRDGMELVPEGEHKEFLKRSTQMVCEQVQR